MSSRIRFVTARGVFEAFPDLNYVATRPADDIKPLDHARALLASSRPRDAIFFISHLLPRREAVWWAIQCVRALIGESGADEALRAAETWVRTPEDDNRRAALLVANASDQRKPSTWLAFAAGWSGGSLLPADQKPVARAPLGMRDGGEHGDHAGGRRRRSARRDTKDGRLRGRGRSLRERRGADSPWPGSAFAIGRRPAPRRLSNSRSRGAQAWLGHHKKVPFNIDGRTA